jgi:hypothetical protein
MLLISALATVADLFQYRSNLIMLDWLNTNLEDKSQGSFQTYYNRIALDKKKVRLFLS